VNERRGLLDTNVLIQLSKLDEQSLPEDASISVITLAELSAGPLVAVDSADRAARLGHLQLAEADFDPIPIDAAVARVYGRVSADLRRAGRKASSRGFDALIAATAIAHDLPLYTANPNDFAGIDGLDVRTVTPA